MSRIVPTVPGCINCHVLSLTVTGCINCRILSFTVPGVSNCHVLSLTVPGCINCHALSATVPECIELSCTVSDCPRVHQSSCISPVPDSSGLYLIVTYHPLIVSGFIESSPIPCSGLCQFLLCHVSPLPVPRRTNLSRLGLHSSLLVPGQRLFM